MGKLIDADVLKQHIDKLPALPDGNFAGSHSALKALINMQPTVQPEIIRCKDCKHYHTDVCGSELGIGGMYENIIVAHDACDRWTKGMNCVEPEGFCFLAERRTDEQTESDAGD